MRPGNTVQISISIPRDLKDQLMEACKKENRSLSNFVSMTLEKAMKGGELKET